MRKKIIFTFFVIACFIGTFFLSGCLTKRELFDYNGQSRSYILHLPPSYDGENQMPLVVVLHGGGGNAGNIEELTGFSKKADAEGFIVVYPDGSGIFDHFLLTWNSGFCCGYALENNIDDVGFIRALVEYLQKNYAINRNMIYVTGMSNGGMMSYRLGAELSDIFAAFAPVAGSIGGQATEEDSIWCIPEPDYPISVIVFHGKNDSRVPYDGGIPTANDTKGAFSYLSVNDSISFFVNHNQCDAFPQRNRSESGNIIMDLYAGGLNNTEVVLYTIVNGTHSWPGGKIGWRNGDVPTIEISATDLIWDFFKDHPKS
ncbi:Esterase PHB depolymerase [uncultured archaeon]|nr:Esterase PHB depolymerase [uncultured archaeon]